MALRDWPAVLAAAGINVRVHPEVSRLGHGPLRDHNIVWHHDASPPGDSPGALAWMKSNFDTASAQVWVDRQGTWHVISYGIAYHAGAVNDQRWNNSNSVGIETDHTTGEDWPTAQLDSLRRGTAAVLRHEGKTEHALAFHKTICVPAGRKSDPDGLDLSTERGIIRRLLTAQPITQSSGEAPEMNSEEREWLRGQLNYLSAIITQGREQEHANANTNAERLIALLERLNASVDLLHADANENARRLEEIKATLAGNK